MPSPFVPPDESRRSYHSGTAGKVIDPNGAATVYDPVDHATYTLRSIDAVARVAPAARDAGVLTFTFETGKYRPPFAVTVRTEADGWVDHNGTFTNGLWTFELPGAAFDRDLKMKLVLNGVFWMRGDDVFMPRAQRHRHFVDREVFFGYQLKFRTDDWRPNHLVTLRAAPGWGRDLYGVFKNDTWEFLLDRAEHPDAFDAKFLLDRGTFMQEADLLIGEAVGQDYTFDDTEVSFPGTPTAYRHGYDNFLPAESPLEQISVRLGGREDDEFDVIVIGSGMGGGTLADALSDRGARTLVLDAGGLWFPVHMNELPGRDVDLAQRDQLGHFVNLAGSGLVYGVHFNLGGRSTYWSGVIPRVREWEMRGVWPESVRRYLYTPDCSGRTGYDKAERVVRKGKTLGPFQDRLREHLNRELSADFEVIDLPRSLHQPNVGADGRVTNVLEKPTGVFSTADLLLDSLGFGGKAGRDNLRVNLHHLVTEIVPGSDGRAEEVVCQDLIGNVERRYRGRYVVLACGSLESPKLALNSGLPDPNGKIGKGLTDHPAYFYNIHHELPRSGPHGWVGDPRGHAKILLQHRRSTPTAHAYNVELLVNPKYWDARHADDDLWDKLVDSERVSKVEIKFSFSSPLFDDNFVRPRAGQKSEVFVEPNETGAPFKAEVVRVRNRVLGLLGINCLSTTWVESEWGQGVSGSVHHAGGTLRMSGDGSGVVDDTLKFHGVDNLYCCDVSVFPTIPAANPALTLVALSLRLADTLADRLGLAGKKALYK